MTFRTIPLAAAAIAFTAGFLLPAGPDDAQADPNPAGRVGKLKPGDIAADFTLNLMHSQKSVTLSSFKNQRPVALIFGSYT